MYDDEGGLHHTGITASFTMSRRKELVDEIASYRDDAKLDHPWHWAFVGTHEEATAGRSPGTKSRWNAGKDLSFEPLRPELVCEVAYDHLQGDRFRHATTFKRWRPDREPPSCTYAQFAVAAPHEVAAIFGAGCGRSPHAWFIAFAPVQDPTIALAVLVERGGGNNEEATGGHVAAPIARQVLAKYFELYPVAKGSQ